VRGKKAKQMRRVTVAEAGAVIIRHQREGTCPNCGEEVETFCSLFLPGVDGVSFGCPACMPAVAVVTQQAGAVREALHRRN